MPSGPYDIVKQFEQAVCDYTGAKYCATTNSCTMALFLCLKYLRPEFVEIPRYTYISVPMQIVHAGAKVVFCNQDWSGSYQLYPTAIYDCARRFTSKMYVPGTFQCVSFHASKILGDTQGGAILHDNSDADRWFRRARFDGRTEGVAPKDDCFDVLGWHCYLSSDVAARLLLKLYSLPEHNEDLPNDPYPDLSKLEIFK